MTHPSEDLLLVHALELHVDAAQREELEAHIDSCPTCRAILDQIHGDLRIISGLQPRSRLASPPFGAARSAIRAYVRVAALLILGFTAGYMTSELFSQRPVTIVPFIHSPSSGVLGHDNAVESDATQVRYRAASSVAGVD